MRFLLASAWLLAAGGPREAFIAGQNALKVGNFAEAQTFFSQAAKGAADWSLAFLELGAVERNLGHLAEAQQALRKAALLDPNNPRIFFELAMAEKAAGNAPGAAAAAERTTVLRPAWAEAWMMLGESAEDSNPDQAIRAYETARNLSPNNLAVVARLASLYEQTHIYAQAESCLLLLVYQNPKVAYHQYQLGQFYQRVGNQPKSQQAFARAAALDPRPHRKLRRLK